MGVGLLQPGFVRWDPLLHKTTLTTVCHQNADVVFILGTVELRCSFSADSDGIVSW